MRMSIGGQDEGRDPEGGPFPSVNQSIIASYRRYPSTGSRGGAVPRRSHGLHRIALRSCIGVGSVGVTSNEKRVEGI